VLDGKSARPMKVASRFVNIGTLLLLGNIRAACLGIPIPIPTPFATFCTSATKSSPTWTRQVSQGAS